LIWRLKASDNTFYCVNNHLIFLKKKKMWVGACPDSGLSVASGFG
jgi:hypothetical protein